MISFYIKSDYKNVNRHCLHCIHSEDCRDFDVHFPTPGNNANDCYMYEFEEPFKLLIDKETEKGVSDKFCSKNCKWYYYYGGRDCCVLNGYIKRLSNFPKKPKYCLK